MNFWSGKRVLITGHTGFKGSWLTQVLLHLGAKVQGYSLAPSTEPSLFQICELETKMSHHLGDIRNFEKVRQCFQSFKPEIVLHLAAQALVRPSYALPLENFETNIMGTANVLEACRELKDLKAVLIVTSDKCYENLGLKKSFQETDPMGGHDPYSASKAAAEIVTTSYTKSFFSKNRVGLASARAGNVIGGGDWSQDRLIPDLMRAYSSQKEMVVRNPTSVRPWQHVLDALDGYLILTQKLYEQGQTFAGGWNFGPTKVETKTTQDILESARKIWPDLPRWQLAQGDQVYEAEYLMLNCEKAQQLLHWQALMNFQQALDKTIRWYQCFYQTPAQIQAETQKQISEFFDIKARTL